MVDLIRRHYVLPLRPDAATELVEEMLGVLGNADRFIPGLLDSSAALDSTGRTVLWENSFEDEAAYTGPYMSHPYHVGAIDDFLMPDSPTALTFGSFAVRFTPPDATRPLRSGVRRIVVFSLDEGDAIERAERIVAEAAHLTTSVFARDDVGWVSGKGRAWTHVWEQGFADDDELALHLASAAPVTPEQLAAAIGIENDSIRAFQSPFELRPAEEQTPAAVPPDEGPVRYILTHRVGADDAAEMLGLLETLYDPFMADHGAPLLDRARTVETGYPLVEIESSWQLESLDAYNRLRSDLANAAGWAHFVRASIPLVKGGRRRFQHGI